ncbi:putative hydroxyacid-oxoacid transhydrogenase, mitochondrial [Toxocara canis]|uniref:hydroxyacid-oxoacid transhydrogenase n=1 Tax=Toxocara canis TaxID=6265 RepID=A0A0B2US39_TOXCA|nr:putative hydroxyacid-oxoacid transhydrogenase, mitochondrial [Toxocara canis]
MSQLRRSAIARSLLMRLANSKQCCPHHASGGDGPICVAKLNSGKGSTDYAFEMICSTLRFGRGVTAEIGWDLQYLRARNTLIVTDGRVANTLAFKEVEKSMKNVGINYRIFDEVQVEPSDQSMKKAIDFARRMKCDSFIAVGGGSSIDTCKAAALYASNPEADFLDFVVAPFGKNLLPTNPMLPLIAVPTTAGTGSETTGVAIFDMPEKKCKTALRHRCLKPLLAIIDPLNVISMPRNVAIYSGFDVLCHALESFTAKPYFQRSPRPQRPSLRPVYQGSNPISDIWAQEALKIIAKYFRRSVNDPGDEEARTQMLMASSFAGMGFGNAGVHLCHGLSYPISSQGKHYTDKDYEHSHPLIPHGLSVVTTAAADFVFTTAANPERHAVAARLLGADLTVSASEETIAQKLTDKIRGFMRDFGVPNGLSALGFSHSDIDTLSDAAMNSMSAVSIAPRQTDRAAIAEIYEKSMQIF